MHYNIAYWYLLGHIYVL